MEHTQLKARIKKVLRTDDRVWDTAGTETELNYTHLFHLLQEIDPDIIDLLFQDSVIQEKFFVKTKNAIVFKHNDFRFFMEENKIDNSYTVYKNRIGLTDGKRFLQDSTDIVLDFPYKDCVLEGGQCTEKGKDIYYSSADGKKRDGHTVSKKKADTCYVAPDGRTYTKEDDKRKEIFFNTILAHDEIDRLLDPKALVCWKRYSAAGTQQVDNISRNTNGIITENLIIKGNNLLALHSLKQQFAGKVKLIYIDPPYNTGGDANTFVYNNTFNHSAWLTFMKNRIEVSRCLLKQDGIICIAIDDEEYAHLKVLIDAIFGRKNYLGTVVVQSNPRGRTINSEFATCHEYCLFYAKNKNVSKINNIGLTESQIKDFKFKDNIGHYRYLPFRRSGGTSTPKERPNSEFSLYYSIKQNKIIAVGGERHNSCTESYKPKFILTLDNNLKIIKHDPKEYFENNNDVEILPTDTSGNRRVWRWSDRLEILKSAYNGDFNVVVKDTEYTVQMKDRIKEGRKPKTIWHDSKYDASSNGTILLKKLMHGKKLFNYPKSIYTVLDTIRITTQDNSEDIILDFFGGSGTTAHAVLELNKEDGGNRKFIMIEQMDYISTVTCPRVQEVLKNGNISDSFIYCQLAKHNETAKEQIRACTNLLELEAFFDTMQRTYFLNYNLKIKEFTEKVIKEPSFKELRLSEQKEIFIAMLDNNQAYIPATEMADKKFKISPTDQTLTAQFYQK